MKKFLSYVLALVILLGFIPLGISPSYAEEEYAWVLVDTLKYPVSKEFQTNAVTGTFEGDTIELLTKNDKVNLHAKYTWNSPPSIIKSKEKVTIRMEQEVISLNTGGYSIGYRPSFRADVANLSIFSGTASLKRPEVVYADGTTPSNRGFILGINGDKSFQKSTWVDLSVEFFEGRTVGSQMALYTSINAGAPGSLGVRYTYEWQKIKPNTVQPTPAPTPAISSIGNSAETFESGSRIMWSPAKGLGYRLFRSTNPSDLGISVTDFYITSTSYADVNVEANTTYYYTVKPVLEEARPFEGIDEKLGDTIATFTVTTGSEVYKPGSFKHFIMLKLESPNMSVDGVNQEVDPGRGTTPLIISGRTMVPIRAIVEAMGGNVDWDDATQKITLKARGNTVEMWLGKTEIKVNGQSKKMDIAPTTKNARTFVPVRFAAENLNCKVDWINSTQEAVIVYEE